MRIVQLILFIGIIAHAATAIDGQYNYLSGKLTAYGCYDTATQYYTSYNYLCQNYMDIGSVSVNNDTLLFSTARRYHYDDQNVYYLPPYILSGEINNGLCLFPTSIRDNDTITVNQDSARMEISVEQSGDSLLLSFYLIITKIDSVVPPYQGQHPIREDIHLVPSTLSVSDVNNYLLNYYSKYGFNDSTRYRIYLVVSKEELIFTKITNKTIFAEKTNRLFSKQPNSCLYDLRGVRIKNSGKNGNIRANRLLVSQEYKKLLFR